MKKLKDISVVVTRREIEGYAGGPFYRAVMTYTNDKGLRQSAIESADDTTNGLFSVLLGAAISTAFEVERLTGEKFRQPWWLRLYLLAAWCRVRWVLLTNKELPE
jgi:hypothetical protein